MKKRMSMIAVTVLLLLTAPFYADERDVFRFIIHLNPVPASDGNTVHSCASDRMITQTDELKSIGIALIRFYQLFISTQDVPSCPFSPTCSEYALQAIKKHGFIPGVIMAGDRYQRCNGWSTRFYRRDPATGRLIDHP